MKTVDISGFGGGYENCCQLMLKNGVEFLDEHPNFSFDKAYKKYQNVGGLVMANNADAKLLDTAIMKGIDDATGGMHEAVVGHLMAIKRLGYQGWLAEFPEDRLFDWDGTTASCPKTELSEKMEKQNEEAKSKQGSSS